METKGGPASAGAEKDQHKSSSQIASLLAELAEAVRRKDRARALQLKAQIERCLVQEQQALEAAERELRELTASLEAAPPVSPREWWLSPDEAQEEAFTLEIKGADRRTRSGLEAMVETSDDAGDREFSRPPAQAGLGGALYPVWFGTNRQPDGSGGFGNGRAATVTRGRVDVHLPDAHRFGETGSSLWKKLLRWDLRDDTLRIQRTTLLQQAAFLAEIQAAIRKARDEGDTPQAVFFLHGFNVSFEEAAIRAAQIGADLKVPGATAFFSSPSRGRVKDYLIDGAAIEASEQAITDFLVQFARECGADKVHVIAHSMGNRGLLRVLQRIAANAQTRSTVKFNQIILAAPDVDRDLFLGLAGLYAEHAERTTLYTSSGDWPVHASAKLHDAPRAGYFTPYTVAPGVDTVAVPDFDIDLLGHSYFAQAEALLHDIHDLMRHGEAPSRRQRLVGDSQDGLDFWRLKR